jgi:lipopolysaccharide/colanic/teichoic acid biosynthesis glycosyltransferase
MIAPTRPRTATGSREARPRRSAPAGPAAIGRHVAVSRRGVPPVWRYRRKRALDLTLGIPLLVLAAPLIALLALAIRCLDGGPVLFRQVRLTAGGKPFELLKLRTVAPDPAADVRWTVPPGGVTGLGAALRRSHLDELPQLINVLRGEMSLVGPRPERPHFAELFAATVPGYPDRYRMPAGITGAAQLRGLCGDTPMAARIVADNGYIERWTLRRDLWILAATVVTTVFGCAVAVFQAARGQATTVAMRGGGRP